MGFVIAEVPTHVQKELPFRGLFFLFFYTKKGIKGLTSAVIGAKTNLCLSNQALSLDGREGRIESVLLCSSLAMCGNISKLTFAGVTKCQNNVAPFQPIHGILTAW